MFELEQRIKEFTHIEDKYGYVTVKQTFLCKDYEDLQDVLSVLVGYSKGPLEFEIRRIKEEGE